MSNDPPLDPRRLQMHEPPGIFYILKSLQRQVQHYGLIALVQNTRKVTENL